jgi:hypothetical protein
MKLKDLYEHTPEQIIKAKQAYVSHFLKKEKITPPKWMARNWKYTNAKYKLIDSPDTQLPTEISSARIYYWHLRTQNTVMISLTVPDYSNRVRQNAILYISSLYQEIFGKTLEKYTESTLSNGTFFIYDPDLLPPKLENAIQTKKLNIMDIVTFQALHEIAKEQEAIK